MEDIPILEGKGEFEWLNQGSLPETAMEDAKQGPGAVVSLLYGIYTELGKEWKPRRETHAKAGQWNSSSPAPLLKDQVHTLVESLEFGAPLLWLSRSSRRASKACHTLVPLYLCSRCAPHLECLALLSLWPTLFLLRCPILLRWRSSQKLPGNRWSQLFGLFLHLHVEWPLGQGLSHLGLLPSTSSLQVVGVLIPLVAPAQSPEQDSASWIFLH